MKQSQPRSLNQVFQRLLFVRLMLPLLLLGLLTTVVMGYTLGRQLENQQLSQARSLNQTANTYLENADRVLKAIVRVTETSGTDELVRYMQATQQAYGYFDTLYCLDEVGRIVALAPVDLRYQGVDMSLQPYFQQAGEQAGVTISSPFISLRTGQPTVWVGRSLRDGGLVVGELNLGALQEAIVARLEQPGSETIFVTDRFGTLLAHPRLELVAQQTNVGDLDIVQRGRTGEVSMLYRIDNTLVLGSAVQMERTDWIIVVQTPFFVTYLPYFGLTGGFLLLVLLMILALMNRLRRILALRVVSPLARLSRSADALAAGNFAQGELVTSSGGMADGPHSFVELDTLTANFRRMSEAIQIRQAALRESEAKYRSLIEQSADAVYLLYEGKFEVINPKFEELFGITSEEARAIDFDFRSLVAPQSQAMITERVQRQEKGEELSPRYEFTARDKEGQEIEVEVSVSYVPYHGGTATQGVLRDITARKRMEERLREREERYRTLVENVPIGVYRNTPGPTGKFLTANPTFLQIFGFDSEEELKAINVSDLYVNPEDRKAFSDRLLAQGHVTGVELQLRKQDGTPIWASVTARVAHDETQGATYFDCTIEDITVRKQIEAEREELLARIRRQAQQVRQIINTVPEGVLVIDAEGRVVQANPVAESALEALASAKKGDIITRLGNRPLYELLTSPPTSGLWHEVEANKRIFEVIARSVHNGSDPETWVLVVRDVTREREIERQARQQERLAAVGQLAAGIAHDFNNILATIVLYTQMISGTEELSARNRKQLATINDQAKQATQLIQQILDFSRRAVIERRPLDLLSLLQEQVQLLERTLSENIQIHLAYEEDEYIINADPGRIQQALTNLALNARDAMSKGGTLRLALQRITVMPGQQLSLPPELKPGDWIQLIVSDTGEGILPRDLPHLFEPFFTTKEPGRGSGLGLAQVHGIVRQHRGHIDVDTEVGAGTTFNIYLPALTSKPPEALSSELPDLIKGRGQTILVVEDNVGTRDALVASLKSLGYRVTKAANGEEALGMLEGMQVELVLSDVVMPKMGGKALLHALREQGIDVPVILLTGHPLMEDLEALREVGLDDWLSKPISLVELAEAVNRALNR